MRELELLVELAKALSAIESRVLQDSFAYALGEIMTPVISGKQSNKNKVVVKKEYF